MLNQNNSEAFVPDAVEQIRTRLEAAATALSHDGESRAPFRFFHLPTPERHSLTPEGFGLLLDVPHGTAVQEVTLEDLLAGYVGEGDSPSRRLRERFTTLLDALVLNLEEPRVFRVAGDEVDYFLAGWTPDGALAGLRTTAAVP